LAGGRFRIESQNLNPFCWANNHVEANPRGQALAAFFSLSFSGLAAGSLQENKSDERVTVRSRQFSFCGWHKPSSRVVRLFHLNPKSASFLTCRGNAASLLIRARRAFPYQFFISADANTLHHFGL